MEECTDLNNLIRAHKGAVYEGGLRVPTCMKWPGVIAAGSRSSTPITSIDFLPTFADLADISLPTGQPFDGESLAPLIRGETALNNRAIFWKKPLYDDATTPVSAMRKGNWKLIEFFENKTLELYDITSDPTESNNLARVQPTKALALHDELIAWRSATNAPVPKEGNPYYRGGGGFFNATKSR